MRQLPVQARLSTRRAVFAPALGAGIAGDATREVRDGLLRATISVDGRLERVQAAQDADGAIHVALPRAANQALKSGAHLVLGLG